ncbi:MAG: tRNA-(ms[2]io[6]A)-hydroxylase [Weeksellaceae bacterium]
MFNLKLPTDPRWANIAEDNLEAILTDHAWCEQKAASNAITIITMIPEEEEIVTELLEIAQEELDHFQQVHNIIKERGYTFGQARKDDYVNDLMKFIPKGLGRTQFIVERMLLAAMIEARSCERFKVLSDNIEDQDLAKFYRELMISEANHYTAFLKYARKMIDPELVNKRWKEWLAYEAEVIASYGKDEKIHG